MIQSIEIVYKIRNIKTNKYSMGGFPPAFTCYTTGGKIWKKLNHLKLHFLQFRHTSLIQYYSDCVVEEIKIEKQIEMHVCKFISPYLDKKMEEMKINKAKQRAAWRQETIKRLKEELKELEL